MARTSKARRRPRKGAARKGKPAAGKITKKRAKSSPRHATRASRPARRPARPARRPAKPARRPAKPARRPAKPARRPAKAAKRLTRPVKRPARARQSTPARPKTNETQARVRPRTVTRPPLDRARRILADDERLELAEATAKADRQDDNLTASAHAGHDALRAELRLHTEAGPEMTAGDVDARWQDAYAVGDEAPGGDNPTPDQGRVDEIGRALGIEYQDGQELQGGEEVLERDRHRWEMDPASSDDWPEKK